MVHVEAIVTDVGFRLWQKGNEDAAHLHRIMAECMPQQPAGSPEEMSARMWSMIQGMEEAAQFALWKGEPVGSVALSNFQNPQHARMGGGVIPQPTLWLAEGLMIWSREPG